jgi:Protein of unknown function (DUF998)
MTTTTPRSGQRAAQFASASAAGFIALFAAVHLVRSDRNATWQFPSDYALGRHGWIMTAAFVAMAVSAFTTAIATRLRLSGWRARIARTGLYISTTGLLIAAISQTDPTGTATTDLSSHGNAHAFGASLLITMPIAIALITWITRRSAHRRVTIIGVVAIVVAIVDAVVLGVVLSRHGGHGGPDVPVAWLGHIELLCDAVWLTMFSLTIQKLTTATVSTPPAQVDRRPMGDARSPAVQQR